MLSRLRFGLQSLVEGLPRLPLILILVAVIGVCGYYLAAYLRFEYHYHAAEKALENEAFDEAGTHLAVCLNLAPKSAAARFLAARTARRSSQFDTAKEELATCADLGWPAEAILLEQTMLSFQRGEFDPVAEQYLCAWLTPTNVDRYVLWEALAQGYMRTYRLIKALDCLDAWLKEQPDSPGALMRRGWVYERLDRLADAEKDYRHLLEKQPHHRGSQLRLGQILLQQGKVAEALPLFQQLQSQPTPEGAVEVGLVQCLARLGRTEEARSLLDELYQRKPNDPTILLEQGKLALTTGRVEEARNLLQKAVAAAPHEFEPHYQLFLCHQRLGEEVLAQQEAKKFKAIEADLKLINDLTQDLQKKPNDPALRFGIAEVFFRRGQEAEGALWLQSLLRLNPNHEQAHRRLAEYFERIGRPALAKPHRDFLAGKRANGQGKPLILNDPGRSGSR